jgi:hypothetical protein
MAFLLSRDVLEQILDLPTGMSLTRLTLTGDVVRAEITVTDEVEDADFLRDTDVRANYGVDEHGAIALLTFEAVGESTSGDPLP